MNPVTAASAEGRTSSVEFPGLPLVLNRNWQPMNVATVARALVLLWNESARVVDPTGYQLYTWKAWSKLRPREDERFIRAVRFRLRVPVAGSS